MSSMLWTNSNAQFNHFKSILNAQRSETLKNLHRAEAEQRGLDTERPAELGDLCIVSSGREELFERINHHRGQLNKIEAALRRIEYGTYGDCAACGREIEPKRLEVIPWSKLCLRCQEHFEQNTAPSSVWPAIRWHGNVTAGE